MAATLKCDTLQNASSATANITLDTAGNATVGGGLTVTNTVAMGSSFLRNKLINGGMRLDQRNAGASQTITAAAALAYTVDRWYAYCTGANVTGQQVANTGVTGSVAQNAYQFTGAASVTAIGFGQRIEATNCFDLAGQTATLSVNLSNSVLTTVTWTAYYANTADTFGTLASPTVTQIATGTFTVSSTLTRYTTNITVPSAATTGIQILFTVGAQTSGTWIIGNVQLERGSVATPFERRQYGQELALCQRYFQAVVPGGASTGAGFINGTTQQWTNTLFSQIMRATPTIVVTGTIGNCSIYWSGSSQSATGYTVSSQTTTNAVVYFTCSSGLTTGQAGWVLMGASNQFTASAEL